MVCYHCRFFRYRRLQMMAKPGHLKGYQQKERSRWSVQGFCQHPRSLNLPLEPHQWNIQWQQTGRTWNHRSSRPTYQNPSGEMWILNRWWEEDMVEGTTLPCHKTLWGQEMGQLPDNTEKRRSHTTPSFSMPRSTRQLSKTSTGTSPTDELQWQLPLMRSTPSSSRKVMATEPRVAQVRHVANVAHLTCLENAQHVARNVTSVEIKITSIHVVGQNGTIRSLPVIGAYWEDGPKVRADGPGQDPEANLPPVVATT